MINTQKQKLMFYSIVSLMLSMATCVKGETTDIKKPEIVLSNVIPVVKKEMEIKIANADSIKEEAIFSITREGKDVVKEKISPVNGVIGKKWIPEETGFYVASFDFGKSTPGKLSLEFPVVYKEIYFVAWPPLTKDEGKKYRYLSSYIILSGSPGSGHGDEEIPYWKSRGSKTLGYTYGMQRIDMGISEDEAIKKAVDNWSAPMKKGFDGILMDEFGEYPLPEGLKKVERAGKALIQLRKENPDMLIFPCISGALLREESIYDRQSGSIALLETYESCFEQGVGTHSFEKRLDYRVMVARNTDALWQMNYKHGTLIFLQLGGGMLISQLEDRVRYIKKTAPEMPGIAFYVSREKQWSVDAGLFQAAENFCLKYYIKPVVDIREIWLSNHTPHTGEEVDIFVRVHNLGGMDARDVKLNIYALEASANKKIPIGKDIIIKKIGAGWVDIKLNKNEKPEYYECQEINGITYPIFPTTKGGTNIIWIDRYTVKASWKPKEKGHYTIIAEVEPADNYTILDDNLEKDICVR